jgi:hypothetical protein
MLPMTLILFAPLALGSLILPVIFKSDIATFFVSIMILLWVKHLRKNGVIVIQGFLDADDTDIVVAQVLYQTERIDEPCMKVVVSSCNDGIDLYVPKKQFIQYQHHLFGGLTPWPNWWHDDMLNHFISRLN